MEGHESSPPGSDSEFPDSGVVDASSLLPDAQFEDSGPSSQVHPGDGGTDAAGGVLHSCLDVDGDGYGSGPGCQGHDCDDHHSGRHPFVPEVCGNEVDDNCDGETDENCPPACQDPDGDRFGEGDGCWGADCAPADPEVHTGLPEQCGNTRDDDCDGLTDEDCQEGCLDGDGDGFGLGAGCLGPDCDDAAALMSPGALELCDDGLDNNCDGRTDEDCPPPCLDPDGDFYGMGTHCAGPDCDEGDAATHPGQTEACANSKDDDCDGETDEGCPVSPPCGEFAACTGTCPDDGGDCEEDCWNQAAAACRRCTLDAWSTCNATWCPVEVLAFTRCRQRNGCEDLRWDGNLDNCTTRSCSQESWSLAHCWSANSGTLLEEYDRVCEPLYSACDGGAGGQPGE